MQAAEASGNVSASSLPELTLVRHGRPEIIAPQPSTPLVRPANGHHTFHPTNPQTADMDLHAAAQARLACSSCTDDERPPSFVLRLASAAHRRARLFLRTLTGHPRGNAAERAVHWLVQYAHSFCLACQPQRPTNTKWPVHAPCCPGVAGQVVQALAEFGQLDAACGLAKTILSLQLAGGGFARANSRAPSVLYTAHAANGLLAVAEQEPAALASAVRAWAYLAARIEPCGRLVPESGSTAPDAWCEAARLTCAATFSAVADRLDQGKWAEACRRAVAWHARRIHLWSDSVPTLWRAAAAEALAELGDTELARQVLRLLPGHPSRNGIYPEIRGKRTTSLATQALIARTRFRLGELEAGARLLTWLTRQQQYSGGLPQAAMTSRAHAALPSDAWSTACFLRACRSQVAAHFAAHGHALPHSISPQDGRMQCVLEWGMALGHGARIAEVGCGAGRYLAQLRAAMPCARLVGIDPDASLLAKLPPEVEGRKGDLLRIPARSGEFDGVLAVESLEHCLLPEHAVRELCRVVRPGGSVLVIDKHAAHQPLSHHEPWERWFWPEELARWLTACGCEVSTRSVAHGGHSRPTGLFVAWKAIRHAVANRHAATSCRSMPLRAAGF